MDIKVSKDKYFRRGIGWENLVYVRQARRNEKNSGTGGGGLGIMKYCRPTWLADEENFPFQIV